MTNDRPLATFLLMAYNQEKFIRAAIEGAFSQDYEPLEIILSDDCSTDGTFDIMNELAASYKGNAQIEVRQNTENLGLIGHLNQLFNVSSGELVILAAGDDISFSDRTAICMEKYNKLEDKKVLFHGNVVDLSETSVRLGERSPPIKNFKPIEELAFLESLYIGATGAISCALINSYKPIQFHGTYEDLVWGFRAGLEDALYYIPKSLVYYRLGVGISGTGQVLNSFKDRISRRYRSKCVMKDVLCQRITDLETREDDYEPLRQKLKKAVEIEVMCAKIWERRIQFSDVFRYAFWFAILRETRALFRISIRQLLLLSIRKVRFLHRSNKKQ